MTDRELLELAAKAAGIGPLDFDYAQREGHGMYFGPRLPLPQNVLMAANYTYWSPLTDDGDALRLAVKLRIDIQFNTEEDHEKTEAHYPMIEFGWLGERWNGDEHAATRRAIVRAAAAIQQEKGK